MAQSYNKGLSDGIKLWGEACGKQSSCATCPIGSIRGTNVTCQDFARQFPEKMLSILKEMNEGEISYFEEYCIRFPHSDLDVETLSKVTCRKAAFEGYLGCECTSDDDCIRCWKETYTDDVTVPQEEE